MAYAPTAVYLLCFVTSAFCSAMLVRSWMRSRTRLLLWSAFCFVMLAVNNLLVVVDLALLPTVDLSVYRDLAALVGLAFLLYGFIWEMGR